MFIITIAPARSVDLRFSAGLGTRRVGPGGRSAVSETIIDDLGEHRDGDSITVEAIPTEAAPHGTMTTRFAEPEGWMVISGAYTSTHQLPLLDENCEEKSWQLASDRIIDIDDSIKITMTPSPIGILRSTFVSNPTPIAGMPELYAHINSLLSPTWLGIPSQLLMPLLSNEMFAGANSLIHC